MKDFCWKDDLEGIGIDGDNIKMDFIVREMEIWGSIRFIWPRIGTGGRLL
jgi:hypothetical protein